jgi:hypothetical protein
MKLTSAIGRNKSVISNIQNALSFAEVQDGALQSSATILNRMAELKSMSLDVIKSDADDCSAPSCTSAKERAFWIFEITDLFLPIADVSFMETANPPASSAGAVIFLPLDNRVRLCWSFALFLVSENEALFAAAFDSIDKAIISNSFL